jgi:brefeldin A-inhibited guanine nucleotide-exchange protein
VFDSVLLPIFDHVRAEVTDTTTFTDDKRRAEVDSWLYDTCTRTLQHIVDIVVQYYAAVTGGRGAGLGSGGVWPGAGRAS